MEPEFTGREMLMINSCLRQFTQSFSFYVAFFLCLVLLHSSIFSIAGAEQALLQTSRTGNTLETHPSPYLRAHADDPIFWQVISRELLETAKEKNKLILISSGYQSCYWCYRMKVDTFRDKKLAKLINETFLPVLIDREMEPAIDQYLQTFMEEQRGFGGWPSTIILTPQGDPVVGFFYTRADALRQILLKFLKQWQADSAKIISLAQEAGSIRQSKAQQQNQLLENPNYQQLLLNFLQQAGAAADDTYGGFGDKEKFPNVPQLSALLDIYTLKPDEALKSFLVRTLNAMQQGALRDQLGGGFFRYAGNRDWSAPHFEQMLYTQAMMAKLYLRAGQAFKRPGYITTGKETLLHMTRQFKGGDGLYDTALSAVSAANRSAPGGYYQWTASELQKLLGKDWQTAVDNLSPDDKTVLPKLIGKHKKRFKSILLSQREQRPREHDTKKILAWHGLVLSGLAYGGQYSPELMNSAQALAEKLMRVAEQKRLQTLIGVPQKEAGEISLENLVYVAQGLLDWWQISADDDVLQTAEALLVTAYEQFYKENNWQSSAPYGLFPASQTRALPDTQLPSASAVWLSLAWALSVLNPESALKTQAEAVGNQLPQALQDEAFFHATLLATVIARQLQVRNNQKQLSPSRESSQ